MLDYNVCAAPGPFTVVGMRMKFTSFLWANSSQREACGTKQALRRVAWYGCDAGSMGLTIVEKNAFLCKRSLVMSMFEIGEFKVKYIV
jgi:hypothetical protein